VFNIGPESAILIDMENDPELDGKYLGQISQDFILVAETLKEAAYQIVKRGFSEQPIFAIAKRSDLPIGQLFIGQGENPGEKKTQWSYYASYLDEFVQRELINKEKAEDFKSTYKDPNEFCCLFVVDEAFTNFLYIPYPVDE